MENRRLRFCYLMVTPTLLVVVILGIYPMLDSIRISLLQYNLLNIQAEGTPFVGLANYRTLFEDPRFLHTLLNTFLFVLIVVPVIVLIGLFIAVVVNREFIGRGVIRTAVLLPWFIPPAVASIIWLWIFQTDRSPINDVLLGSGLLETNIRYLTDANRLLGTPVSVPMLAVSAVRVWHGLPFVILLLLAGLQSLPEELYEAARIDGANGAQRFLFITIPLLRPVLTILITLLLITGIGHFEINYIMTNGGPQDMTNILAVLSYQQAFTFYRVDLAAATSTIILLATALVAVVYIRAQMRED